MASKYDPANDWSTQIPPITREEAERAAKRLIRKFGSRKESSIPRAKDMEGPKEVRRCWIAVTEPYGDLDRGWRRLVHDVSHRIFRYRYPKRRPHDSLHARLEAEMVRFVLASGWLTGTLRPAEKEAPKRDHQAVRYARAKATMERAEKRLKLAQAAIKRIKPKLRYYERIMDAREGP